MALRFGAVNSDRVSCGSPAAFDALTQITWLLWVRPTTFAHGDTVMSKRASAAGKTLGLNGTTGNLQFLADRATTDTSYITNDTPLTLDEWNRVAVTFDQALTNPNKVHILVGDLRNAAVESSYGTANDGSGAYSSDAAADLILGNTSALTDALIGDIAVAALFGSILSVAACNSWFENPRIQVNASGPALGMWHLGLDPAGVGSQPDLTGNGNPGTVTGATQIDHVPLFQFLEARRRRARQIARVGQQILRRVA